MTLSTNVSDCGCVLAEIPAPSIEAEIYALGAMCTHGATPWTAITEIDPTGPASVAFAVALGQCILALSEEMEILGDYDYRPHTDRFFFQGEDDIFGLVFTGPGQMAVKWNACHFRVGEFHQSLTLSEYRDHLYRKYGNTSTTPETPS